MSTLNNLKILDFTTLIPGPFATMMMGDMGADIIKVESPTRLDLVRAMGPFNHGSSTSHSFVNRNKRSISLDLKKQKSIAELVKQINPILAAYSAENKIDMIISKNNIIIGKKDLDITSKILELVNKKVKKIKIN